MTKYAQSDATGRRGEHAVEGVWLDVEPTPVVRRPSLDSGEDLEVQVCDHDRNVTPVRIWVQVKSTNEDCSDPTRSVPPVYGLDPVLMLRWHNTADLVVVVRWDLMNKVGWFALPGFGPDKSGQDSWTTVRFCREDVFDIAAAQRLIQIAEIQHEARSHVWTATVMTGMGPRARPDQHDELKAGYLRVITNGLELLGKMIINAETEGDYRIVIGDPGEALTAAGILAGLHAKGHKVRLDTGLMTAEELVRKSVADIALAAVERRVVVTPLLLGAVFDVRQKRLADLLDGESPPGTPEPDAFENGGQYVVCYDGRRISLGRDARIAEIPKLEHGYATAREVRTAAERAFITMLGAGVGATDAEIDAARALHNHSPDLASKVRAGEITLADASHLVTR